MLLSNIPLFQAVQVNQSHPVCLGSPLVHADLAPQVHPLSQVQTACTQVLQSDPWVLVTLANPAVLLVQHLQADLHNITTTVRIMNTLTLYSNILLGTKNF